MEKNLHNIDKLFTDGIEGHEEMPPASVWDAIDNNLDKGKIALIKKKYNNLKRLSVLLLLLLTAVIVYEIQTRRGNKDIAGKNETTSADLPAKNNSIQNEAIKAKNKNGAEAPVNNRIINNTDNAVNSTQANNTGNTKELIASPTAQIKAPPINEPVIVINDNQANLIKNEQPQKKSLIKGANKSKTAVSITNGTTGEFNDNNSAVNKLSPSANLLPDASPDALSRVMPEKIKSERTLKETGLLASGIRKIIKTNTIQPYIAKNNTSKVKKTFNFSVMPFFAPQFTFNRIEDDSHDNGQGGGPGGGRHEDRDAIKKSEPDQASSYSAGILAEMPIGKKLSIQSGINILHKTTDIQPKKIYAKLDNDGKVKYLFDCSSGYSYITPKNLTTLAVGDSTTTSPSTNTLQYIGIPLALKYNLTVGRFTISPQAGAAANILVQQKIATEITTAAGKEKQNINDIQGLKPAYFTGFAGVALDYHINKHIAISIVPAGNFALTSINKNAAVKSYPNSFGLSGGIKIKF